MGLPPTQQFPKQQFQGRGEGDCMHVLARIFLGPRREKQITAASRILRDLHCNDLYVG